MSKMDTKGLGKAAQRAAKAGKLPPGFELRPVEKAPRQARVAGRFSPPPEDPRKAALSSRCRRFGISASEQNRARMDAVHMCCELGFVMEALCKRGDAKQLWDVFHRWTCAEINYRTRYIGQGEQPASAALMMIPDRIETDQSHTVDTRTPEQRDRDAVTSWMRWHGYLGHLSAADRALLHGARRGDGAVLWRDCAPTMEGVAALAALRALAAIA